MFYVGTASHTKLIGLKNIEKQHFTKRIMKSCPFIYTLFTTFCKAMLESTQPQICHWQICPNGLIWGQHDLGLKFRMLESQALHAQRVG